MAVLAMVILNYRATRRLNIKLDGLIRDRTLHLERIHSELYRSRFTRRLYIHEAATQIKATLATLRGICHVGRIDSTELVSIDKLDFIEKTANEINSIIDPLISHGLEKE
jgi:hypothetical protein